MQEDDSNEKGSIVASIMNRIRDLKSKYKHEDNSTDELNFTKVSADTTDNSGTVNHIMMTANNPEDWMSFLLKLEKKGNPQRDTDLLNRLIGRYSQAVAALPAEKYSQNESYARILVRFAELKAIEDPEEARDQFHLARLNCKKFAFVHVSFAQFELTQGNVKKSKQLLEKAAEYRAVPLQMLEIALRNLSLQKKLLLSDEEKENLAVPSSQYIVEDFLTQKKNVDSGEITTNNLSLEEKNSSPPKAKSVLSGRKPLKPLNKSNQMCPFGRVPIKLIRDDEDDDTADSMKMNIPRGPSVIKRQISDSSVSSLLHLPLQQAEPSGSNSYQPGNLKLRLIDIGLPQSNKGCNPKDTFSGFRKEGVLDSWVVSPPTSQEHPHSFIPEKKSTFLRRSLIELSNEESTEVADISTVTLKNTHGSSNAVKRKETKQQHEELRTTESICQQQQNQNCASLESNKKEKEQFSLNSLPSGNIQLHLEERQKRSVKGKNPTFALPTFQVSKRFSPPELISQKFSPPETVSKRNSQSFIGTASNNTTLNMACFSTPVVKNDFLLGEKATTPYNHFSCFQPCTPSTPFQVPSGLQIPTVPSNECVAVKGKWYSLLKQIGSGGSSKVFQVLDDKKQLYAIKYVDLQEADQQTKDSYKNEIAHLNKLQQHSDKIIRLYDYEINENCIYMVMECGNIDLNSWLKKKKTINPWERKSYWKNMLEAVHTIHQHGIVHSDLKPANFLLVDGMLKLIDFGIASQMQPDVTSIVKDSQVGTVNYMPPEAIKDMSSSGENEKSRSKISPKSDVWSLGCILYCMTYGRTPFQHITNQITKLHAIIDPSYEIAFPDIAEKDLQDVLKRCLIRNPKQRISISELLVHPYVHIQANIQTGDSSTKETAEEMKRILGHLGLNSPNSIARVARTLYEHATMAKN